MFRPILNEIAFIGLLIEGFVYGLYSGIFVIYLQYQASKKDTTRTQNVIFYSICALYVLSVAVFVCDIAGLTHQVGRTQNTLPDSAVTTTLFLRIGFIQTTSFACCDFMAQFILIYRCWIVWGHNIRVVIIPSILAFAFLGTWLSYNGSEYISSGQLVTPGWGRSVLLTSLAMSLTVNALVTGLIVFRIFKVFREVKATSDNKILSATGTTKLRRTILVLIESGMALFSIQLARFVVTLVGTDAAYMAFTAIAAIHDMLNGLIPTIILVGISMGLSCHDEKSMEEVAIESLRFASHDPNSVPEIGSIDIVGQDSGDNDTGVQGSHDIDIIER